MPSHFNKRIQELSHIGWQSAIVEIASSIEQQQRIDAICSRFEQLCQTDPQLTIESQLATCDPEDKQNLLLELVAIEVELNSNRGVKCAVTDYIDRFPNYRDPLASLFEKIELLSHSQTENDITHIDKQGRYACVAELARGGMGVVFSGWDRTLDRPVAIKIINRTIASDPEARARFHREPRICGSLQHPNVVPVYDVGQTIDGDDFFVMKLVDGQTLEVLLENGITAKTRDEWLAIFLKIANAIAAAHRNGIYHRDIKPSNIMISGYGEVYVMDWGLSGGDPLVSIQSPLKDKSTEANLTKEGGLFGTLNYMPPELESINSDRSNPRVDVYSLGAVLCEILTGKTPRKLYSRSEATGPAELAKALEQVIDDRQLLGIISCALAPDPASRYGNASEMVLAIQAYRNGVLERARKAERDAETAIYQAKMISLRWKTAAALMTSVLLVTSVMVWGYSQLRTVRREQLFDAKAAFDRAEVAFDSAALTKDLSKSNWNFVGEIYEVSRSLADKHGDPNLQMQGKNFEKKLRLVDDLTRANQFPFDPKTGFIDFPKGLDAYIKALTKFGIDAKRMTLDQAREELSGLGPSLDKLITEQLIYFSVADQLDDQRWWLELAQRSETEVLGSSITNAILAADKDYLGNFAETEDLTRLSSSVLNRLAMELREFDLLPQAELVYRKAIEIYPNDAMTNNDFGVFLYIEPPRRSVEALTYFGAAMAVSDLPTIKWNYADCLIRAGDKETGFDYLEKLLSKYPENEFGRLRLAKRWIESGRISEGEDLLKPMLAADPALPAASLIVARLNFINGNWQTVENYLDRIRVTRPVDFQSFIEIADIYKRMGMMERAIEIATSMLATDRFDKPDEAYLHYFLGGLYTMTENFEKGISHYLIADKVRDLPAEGHFNLAFALRSLGRSDEAVEYLRRGQSLAAQRDDLDAPVDIWIADAEREAAVVSQLLNGAIPPQGIVVSIEDDARNILAPHGYLMPALNLLDQTPIGEATTDQLLLEATVAAQLLISDWSETPELKIAEVRYGVMEQMALCLEHLLEMWSIDQETEQQPHQRLVQLRTVNNLRSLDVLRSDNLFDQLPRGHQDTVVNFWKEIDRRISLLTRSLP